MTLASSFCLVLEVKTDLNGNEESKRTVIGGNKYR